jgi:hypothetical protein
MKSDLHLSKFKCIFFYSIVLVLCLSSLFLVSCSNTPNYPALVDPDNKYEEVSLSEEQKVIYPNCTIENYYVSGEKKIFYVISERGYVDKINLIILLDGSTIQKIQGIDIKESDNYGMKCFSGDFLTQFEGIDLLTIEVVRGKETPYDEGEIIYVTHATTTSKAIISAINAVATFIRN